MRVAVVARAEKRLGGSGLPALGRARAAEGVEEPLTVEAFEVMVEPGARDLCVPREGE